MNLHHIYAEASRLAGTERHSRLVRAVKGVALTPRRPETWAEAAPIILPAVRAASWAATGMATELARRRLVPFVQTILAIDFPASLTYVTRSDLDRWGVTATEAEATAARNLVGRFDALGQTGPVGFMAGPDGYASSWLAVPDTSPRSSGTGSGRPRSPSP
jgi:hypothetical protein